jgi:acyl carrier protein
LTTIDERLQEIARHIFNNDDLVLTDDTTAADVPGWDSLAHVSFMYSVEEEFDVRFSDDEFAGFSNIAGLRQRLDAKLAAGA